MNSINIVNYKNGFTAVILKLLRPGKILLYTNGSNKPLGYCNLSTVISFYIKNNNKKTLNNKTKTVKCVLN